MVFGLSTTSLVLVLGAGALVLGPRDVPLVAKFFGRATGRAVAHVGHVMRAVENASKQGELQGIRAEVQESMRDLRGVAREIERGVYGGDRGVGGASASVGNSSRPPGRLSMGSVREMPEIAKVGVTDVKRHPRVVPVDARTMGATPASGKFGTSGSDVLAASHKEREVAVKAARLMESGEIDMYLAKREGEGGARSMV